MSNNNNNLANKLNGVSKSYHYNLPQEVRDLLAQAATALERGNSNNSNTRQDGSVNCDNPRVVAALVDGMGMILTRVFHDLKANPELLNAIPDSMQGDLDSVLHTMRLIRNNIGVDTDWYGENQADLIPTIMRESETAHKAYAESIVKAMLAAGIPLDMIPPQMRPKPDAAETADAILDSLRADGVIG